MQKNILFHLKHFIGQSNELESRSFTNRMKRNINLAKNKNKLDVNREIKINANSKISF